MPAHKQKKSKKSHKHRTKHDSNFLHKVVMWKENFLNLDSDSSENEDKLTYLVRRSYTNHLQEALIQNFEVCTNSSTRLTSDSIEEMVEKWSSALEDKALKACMIKEQYRKNMVSLVKHIKTATNNRKLCFEEQSLCSLMSTLPSNKETQTENFTIDRKMVTAETQTDCTTTSLFKQNFSNTLRSSWPYDSTTCVSSSQPWDTSGSNQDVCRITSTSDLNPPKTTTNISITDNERNKNLLDGLSLPVDSISSDNKCSLTEVFFEKPSCLETKKFSDKTFDQVGDSSGQLQEHSKMDFGSSCGPSISEMNIQNSFDFNISAVESLSDIDMDNNLNQLTSWKNKKSNWYAEETAQMCNLTRVLLQMSIGRRERVINKIKELFGDKEIPLAELSVKNITICRKRIASAVVMELTPIYKSKRIASRKLFKYLAQKITKSIMEQSYAPDTRVVRWKVKEFFSDGKTVTNETDCN